MKRIKTVWELREYDVWGNKRDGYEVNNYFVVNRQYELTLTLQTANPGTDMEFQYATPTDLQIKKALLIKPRVHITTEGDDTHIYVNHESTGYPFGELHCVSHESLSPIRETVEV